MRIHYIITTIAAAALLLYTSLYADKQAIWQPTKDVVINYKQLIKQLPKNSEIKIRIPQEIISYKTQKVYANVLKQNAQSYFISFDSIQNCHGAKYCNIGSISGELNKNPKIYYDLNNQEITQLVILDTGLRGYFTPAHAMADYWPSMLVWRQGNALYTIKWKIPNTTTTQTQITLMKILANYTLIQSN